MGKDGNFNFKLCSFDLNLNYEVSGVSRGKKMTSLFENAWKGTVPSSQNFFLGASALG